MSLEETFLDCHAPIKAAKDQANASMKTDNLAFEKLRNKLGRRCSCGWLVAGLLVMVFFEVLLLQTGGSTMTAEDKNNDASSGINLVTLHSGSYDLSTEGNHLAQIVMKPDTMYKEFGIVSPPVLALSAKAFFNFGVQQALLLGPSLGEGWASIKERLESEAHFSKLSIGFQVIGQMSTVYSYFTLVQVSQPWEGGENLETFYFLVSQHSASITLVVGLCNNLVIQYFVASKVEMRIAQALVVTGMIVGIPLWSSIALAGFPINLIYIAGAICVGAKFSSLLAEMSIKDVALILSNNYKMNPKISPAGAWDCVLTMGLTCLSVVWFFMGCWTHPLYSLLNFGAFFVELALPLYTLSFFTGDLSKKSVGYSTSCSFINSLWCVYVFNMIVPTALLSWHGHATDSAPLVFMGKKIGAYFNYTFSAPAKSAFESSTKHAHAIAVWLSGVVGLPA